jgi:hypothetical protein
MRALLGLSAPEGRRPEIAPPRAGRGRAADIPATISGDLRDKSQESPP